MRILFTLIVGTVLASCATTLTRRAYNLKVSSNTIGDKIEINKEVYSLPTEIKVRRSKTDLQIKLISGTVVTEYKVRSSPNRAFVYGNLLWMQAFPAAYLIDLTNQKRFYYGKSVVLRKDDSLKIVTPKFLNDFETYFSQKFPKSKGQFDLTLSIPYFNSFLFKPENEPQKAITGFFGLSIGLDYYYKDKRYFNLTAGAVTDIETPFPVAIDYLGVYETLSSTYVSLTHNHKVNRFHFGYGINYSKNTWNLRNEPYDSLSSTVKPVTKFNNSFGFTLSGYHQVTEHFLFGLIYRPTVFRITPKTDLRYEYLVVFDLAWKIRINK